jgi:aspartate/tyrosine/aromatic aminotransferase
MYLLEKNGARLVYATDTGGIPCKAAQIVGIDGHSQGKPITGLIMEATMGIGYDDDFRLYTHSSVATVHQIYRVLQSTGRYTPPEGQPVYLTHMARTLHGTQAELDAQLPAPLKAAHDGLEVVFKAV